MNERQVQSLHLLEREALQRRVLRPPLVGPYPEEAHDAAHEVITEALVTAARAGVDTGDLVAKSLRAAADRLGSVERLLDRRPGSWEAEDIRHLAGPDAEVPR
jgi:hypothetical protein